VNAFQLANFLISLHHDRSRIQKKAVVARSSVEHLTWKNSAKEFMAAVGSLGEKPAEVVFPPAGSGEVLDPATSAAVKDGTWWTELAQRVGPGYVALAPQRLEHQTAEIQKLLTPILGARKFSLGLDYGCGACRFTPEIAAHCTNVLAADLVDPCRPADLPANVAFQKVAPDGGHWLRLKDGSVEFLWCSLVLQHICSAELFLNVAAELRRVLAPGALVVILDDLGPASTTRRIHPREPAFLAAVLGLSEYTSRPVDIDQRFSKHQLLVGVKA
jgi:SAM-dependent methyltransferase